MNYEEKYKEALKRANAAHKDEDRHLKATLENIFPELVESEDEKIRKALVDFFNRGAENGEQTNGVCDKDILAWLEKQKEKSIWTDNDRTMAFTLLRDIDQMTYISAEGKNERLEWLNSLDDRFKNE